MFLQSALLSVFGQHLIHNACWLLRACQVVLVLCWCYAILIEHDTVLNVPSSPYRSQPWSTARYPHTTHLLYILLHYLVLLPREAHVDFEPWCHGLIASIEFMSLFCRRFCRVHVLREELLVFLAAPLTFNSQWSDR